MRATAAATRGSEDASTTMRAWTVSSWLTSTAFAVIASRRSRGGASGAISSGGVP
jgi:hypothetical protein